MEVLRMKKLKHLSFTALRMKMSEIFAAIADWRQPEKISHSIHDVLMSGFACMHFQDPSLLQFQQRMKKTNHRSNLQTLFGVGTIPKETQMREVIDMVDSKHFGSIFKDYYLRLQRGKYLEQYQLLPGYYYFPMDGSEIFSSNDIHCQQCLSKTHLKGVNLKIKLKVANNQIDSEVATWKRNNKEDRSLLFMQIKDTYQWKVLGKDAYDKWELKGIDPKNEAYSELNSTKSSKMNSAKKKALIKIAEDVFETEYSSITYSHQVLQGGIAHPNMSQVIPFMPEQICNNDGGSKQDCELNAGKRYIAKIRKAHPQIGLIIGGDALFSRQPIIEDIIEKRMHYIFVAKSDDHRYLMEWIDAFDKLNEIKLTDKKGYIHIYEWMNNVPLSGREDAVRVNFFRCKLIKTSKEGKEKIVYKSSWVTDIDIDKENIEILVKGGRCRWKSENEIFNVMKNHGYYMDHNYGHGKNNLCFNFYLLTLLAFFFHQIFELTDQQYQACREKFGSKRHMWETLRAYIKIIIFETWDALLRFAFDPEKYQVTLGSSP